MPRPPRDLDRILHIARLHYEDRLTQAEIARQMSLSVATVSRHLQQASALGLVETRVASSAYRDFALEAELVRRLGLVWPVSCGAAVPSPRPSRAGGRGRPEARRVRHARRGDRRVERADTHRGGSERGAPAMPSSTW